MLYFYYDAKLATQAQVIYCQEFRSKEHILRSLAEANRTNRGTTNYQEIPASCMKRLWPNKRVWENGESVLMRDAILFHR
jgi:hypothetical protein